jgi:hypothetical protein
MSNPFQEAEAWDVSTEKILGEGNHIVDIKDAQMGTSSGGHPQIELQLGNIDGEIRDWLVITDASVGKVVSLAQAAGVALPEDDDIEKGLTLKQVYVDRFVGRQVGIVVRMEKSFKDETREISRVQGYVDPARIKGSDVPNGGNAFRHPKPKPAADVPF